jgi:LuxR family transcriptional regulator, maltose regulon positive regulatory protein
MSLTLSDNSVTVRQDDLVTIRQLSDHRVTVPSLPPGYVSRPRLLDQLDRAAERPLTLLCAAPGAGKSALLAEWSRQASVAVAWLSPAPADAEAMRFGRLLQSALPSDDGLELASLAEATADPGQEMVRLLLDRAAERDAPLVIIIDDAHVLDDPGVLDALDALIRSPQPWVRLILAGRGDPALPLHRYRLAGQLLELREADLAMTPAETREVLAEHGVSLPEADLAVLVTRTEGWAAGVRLLAMRMQGAEHPAAIASQLAMDPGSIGEYLMDEVLRQLPGEQRRMLIETSFLAQVTGPLADAVTASSGSGEVLADLARRNSFVIPLDPQQARYRYHHLLGEVLRYLLDRLDEQSARALKQRAADWFEASGDLGNAVYWALQAGNGPQAAALLARGGLAHAFVRRVDLPAAGLRALLPSASGADAASGGAAHPGGAAPDAAPAEAAVASAVSAAICATPESAAGQLRRLRAARAAPARAALAGPALPGPAWAATVDLAELILGQKAGDADAIDAAARRLLSEDAGDAGRCAPLAFPPGLRAAVLLAQASAHLWHGRHDDVSSLLDAALAGARRDGLAGIELEVLAMMALNDSLWCRMSRASETTRQARDLQRRNGLATPAALELATAVRACVSADFRAQARALQRAGPPDVAGADPGLAAALALGQAAVFLEPGHEAGARAMLLRQASRPMPPLLAVRRDLMIAALDTALGRPRAALTLLEGYRGTEFEVLTAMGRARAHLALGEARQARECVRCVLITPSAQVSRLDLVAALLCDASIAQADGERGRALEALTRAIEMARGDIVLPFLQAGDAFADLLARHPDVGGRWPAPPGGRPRAAPAPAAAPPPELVDPLTQRELTILRLLNTSMSTVEIAGELCLSVNTVKTHLAAIYRKLPASRRREAVLRARELELI